MAAHQDVTTNARFSAMLIACTTGATADGLPSAPFVQDFEQRLAVACASIVVRNGAEESPLHQHRFSDVTFLLKRAVTIPPKWQPCATSSTSSSSLVEPSSRLILALVVESILPFSFNLFADDDLAALQNADDRHVSALRDRLRAHAILRNTLVDEAGLPLRPTHFSTPTLTAMRQRLLTWVSAQHDLFGRVVSGLVGGRRRTISMANRVSNWAMAVDADEKFELSRLHAVMEYGAGKHNIVYHDTSDGAAWEDERYHYKPLGRSAVLFRRSAKRADEYAWAVRVERTGANDELTLGRGWSAVRVASVTAAMRADWLFANGVGVELDRIVIDPNGAIRCIVCRQLSFPSFVDNVLIELPNAVSDGAMRRRIAHAWARRMLHVISIMQRCPHAIGAAYIACDASGDLVVRCMESPFLADADVIAVLLKLVACCDHTCGPEQLATMVGAATRDDVCGLLVEKWQGDDSNVVDVIEKIKVADSVADDPTSTLFQELLHMLTERHGFDGAVADVDTMDTWRTAMSDLVALRATLEIARLDTICGSAQDSLADAHAGFVAVQSTRRYMETVLEGGSTPDKQVVILLELESVSVVLTAASNLCSESEKIIQPLESAYANRDRPNAWYAASAALRLMRSEVVEARALFDTTWSSRRADEGNGWTVPPVSSAEVDMMFDFAAICIERKDWDGARRLLSACTPLIAQSDRSVDLGRQADQITAQVASAQRRQELRSQNASASANRRRLQTRREDVRRKIAVTIESLTALLQLRDEEFDEQCAQQRRLIDLLD